MSKIVVKCNEKREIVKFSSTAFEDINKLDDSWYMTNLEGDGGMYSYPNSVYETYDEFGRPKYKLDNLNNIKEIAHTIEEISQFYDEKKENKCYANQDFKRMETLLIELSTAFINFLLYSVPEETQIPPMTEIMKCILEYHVINPGDFENICKTLEARNAMGSTDREMLISRQEELILKENKDREYFIKMYS